MGSEVVTVEMDVMDRNGVPRWAVVASFVGIDGAEPRCIDYRVRVVPTPTEAKMGRRVISTDHVLALHRTLNSMSDQAAGEAEAAQIGEIPPEGIPGYVFQQASQARLLTRARGLAERRPDKVDTKAQRVLRRAKVISQEGVRRGRPPVRDLGEKLRILEAVDRGFREGRTRGEVAREFHMSEGALRDLLHWARHTANPPLFTNYGPGRRGGELTPEARALIAGGE